MNSENGKLVAAILVAALYPNIVQVLTPEVSYSQTGAGKFSVHMYMVNLNVLTESSIYKM